MCLKFICKIIFARLGIRATKHKSQIYLWFFSTDLRIGFENLSLCSSEVRVYSVKFHRSDAQSDHRALSFGRLNNSMHYSSYSLFPFGIVTSMFSSWILTWQIALVSEQMNIEGIFESGRPAVTELLLRASQICISLRSWFASPLASWVHVDIESQAQMKAWESSHWS
jgi:hypothetical protein